MRDHEDGRRRGRVPVVRRPVESLGIDSIVDREPPTRVEAEPPGRPVAGIVRHAGESSESGNRDLVEQPQLGATEERGRGSDRSGRSLDEEDPRGPRGVRQQRGCASRAEEVELDDVIPPEASHARHWPAQDRFERLPAAPGPGQGCEKGRMGRSVGEHVERVVASSCLAGNADQPAFERPQLSRDQVHQHREPETPHSDQGAEWAASGRWRSSSWLIASADLAQVWLAAASA